MTATGELMYCWLQPAPAAAGLRRLTRLILHAIPFLGLPELVLLSPTSCRVHCSLNAFTLDSYFDLVPIANIHFRRPDVQFEGTFEGTGE